MINLISRSSSRRGSNTSTSLSESTSSNISVKSYKRISENNLKHNFDNLICDFEVTSDNTTSYMVENDINSYKIKENISSRLSKNEKLQNCTCEPFYLNPMQLAGNEDLDLELDKTIVPANTKTVVDYSVSNLAAVSAANITNSVSNLLNTPEKGQENRISVNSMVSLPAVSIQGGLAIDWRYGHKALF